MGQVLWTADCQRSKEVVSIVVKEYSKQVWLTDEQTTWIQYVVFKIIHTLKMKSINMWRFRKGDTLHVYYNHNCTTIDRSVKGRVKSTGPLLKHDNASEAGDV